jgi:hypothetical protein
MITSVGNSATSIPQVIVASNRKQLEEEKRRIRFARYSHVASQIFGIIHARIVRYNKTAMDDFRINFRAVADDTTRYFCLRCNASGHDVTVVINRRELMLIQSIDHPDPDPYWMDPQESFIFRRNKHGAIFFDSPLEDGELTEDQFVDLTLKWCLVPHCE